MPAMQEAIMIQDNMSSAFSYITQSMAAMEMQFEITRGTVEQGMDASSWGTMRASISTATRELSQYREEMQRSAAVTIPVPAPEPAPEPVPEPVWEAPAAPPVFLNSGADRFAEELRSADQMAQKLFETQLNVSAQARRMDVTPPGMLNDIAAMEIKVQFLAGRIGELSNMPVDLRTDATNNELEQLRGKLSQAMAVQKELSLAMSGMDISGANSAYQRLNSIVDSTDTSIRDNLTVQSGFNQSVENGKRCAESLKGALKNIAMSAIEAFDIQKVMAMADAYTQTSARLGAVNYGFDSTSQLQEKIFESAQRSRVSCQALADSVTQMGTQARSAFGSNDELIAFNEQLNKSFAIAGVSPQDMQGATSQLTQVLANGVMSGDELNSVFGQTPAVMQNIADYMGVPSSELQNMAAQGMITADVIKNSMLQASEATNQKFSEMPVTFQQMGTVVKDALLEAFQPVLQAIAEGATWIFENWSVIAPIFYGVAAGALVLAAVLGIQALATFLASVALQGLFKALLANPLTWIILAIGLVVGMIYSWIQSVGGIKVAWLICVNAVLTFADALKMGLMVAWHNILIGIDGMIYGFEAFKVGVLNALGDLKVMGLTILQSFINGAIDQINELIKFVNLITGTNIDIIAHVDFASKAALEEQAKQSQRQSGLAALKASNDARKKDFDKAEYEAQRQHDRREMEGRAEIEAAKSDSAAKAAEQDAVSGFSGTEGAYEAAGPYGAGPYGGAGAATDAATAANTGNTAANTAAMANEMDVMEEDLKYMRDVAEQEIINRFTLAELKVDMTNNNTLKTETDFDRMAGMIADVTGQILASSAEGGHL